MAELLWLDLAETFLRPPLNIEFDAFAGVIVLDCLKNIHLALLPVPD